VASIRKRPDGRWRARYRDGAGKEHARHFDRKVDGQRWLDGVTASIVAGTHVEPKTERMTVGEFGAMPLAAVRPSHVRSWTARLRGEGYEASYVYALHGRLAQVFADAVHDGIVPRSPCSRRTSPGQGKQRPYVATTEQVWALYEAFPAELRAAVLLGAFAGLRVAEACGLRPGDVDFMRGVIHPAVQYPAEDLKTEISRTPIPVAQSLVVELAEQVRQWPGDTVLTDGDGGRLGPWALERAMRTAHVKVDGLPAGFRYHDLRHYLLIASGADVKTVQARLRHASAKTTLDTYGHMWPDRDESTRAAVEAVFAARADSLRTAAGQR
jgi:integrase